MTERRNLSSRMNSMDIGPDSVDFEPRVRRPLIAQYPPLKTTIAAVVLLLGGIIFLSLGLSIMFSSLISHGKDRGLAMVILGGLSKFEFYLLVAQLHNKRIISQQCLFRVATPAQSYMVLGQDGVDMITIWYLRMTMLKRNILKACANCVNIIDLSATLQHLPRTLQSV